MADLWTITVIIGSICFLVGVVYCYLERRRILKHLGGLNRYPEVPIMGSTHLIAFQNTENISDVLYKYLNEYELPCFGFVGPTIPVLVLGDPGDVHTFLSDPNALQKPYIYKFFKNERGLVTSEPHVWKVHRKILNPSFSFNVLKHLIPLFKDKVDKLIADINENDSGQHIDMLDVLYVCTLDMIVDSATGVSIDSKSPETKQYLQSVITGADLIATRMIKVWLHMEWTYRLSSLYDFEKKAYKIIKAYLGKIILSRKEIFDRVEGNKMEEEKEQTDIDELVDGQPRTVINQLLRNWANGTIDYKDVFDELDVLIYTGSDTSTHLAAYTLLMLAMHPEVQERVISELKSVFVSRDVPVDYDSIKQLPYLETVIKETLRLFPVIPYIGRWSGEDVKLKTFTVPKGTLVFVPLAKMSRDPKVWGPDAEQFNPDHFLPERINKLHQHQYIPFSCGPRNCIGKTYAQLAVRTIVSQILINFVPETSLKMKDIKMVLNITLRITNPDLVRLRKRTNFWEE